MGIVLRARQLSLDRVVALKVISPELAADEEFRRRFERESRLMASVTHPNVVAIHEAGEADGHLFVAMRWVDGTDLRRLIAQDGPLPPPFAADVVAQAAGALDALHDAGLVHRDVKPANILIEAGRGRPVAYLADFGLSMPVGSGVERLTRTGAWVGTVDYVAPEQIEDGPIDRRTDVYALGGVLYEALTGSVAFPRSSDSARLWAHLNEPPPSPRDIRKSVPAELGEVVRRALAKDPQRRWPTAGALGRAAVSAAGEDRARLTISGPSMLIGEVPEGGSRARAAILTFVGIAVVALAAILLAGGTGGNSTTTQTGRALPTAAVHVERFSLGRNVAPGRLAAVDDAVYVVDRHSESILVVDPASGLVERRLHAGRGRQTIVADQALAHHRAWVLAQGTGNGSPTLREIDTRTSRLEGRPIDVQPDARFVADTGREVAVLSLSDTAPMTLLRIDPVTRHVLGAPRRVAGTATDLTGDDDLFVLLALPPAIARLTNIGAQVEGGRLNLGPRADDDVPSEMAIAGTTAWIACTCGRVLRYDTVGNRQVGAPIRVGREPLDIAVSGGTVWVPSMKDRTLTRIDAATGRRVGRPIAVGDINGDVATPPVEGPVWLSGQRDLVRVSG